MSQSQDEDMSQG